MQQRTMYKGVITGDLVDSTKIDARWRPMVADTLTAVVADFTVLSTMRLEMFRGDSFQIVVDDIRWAMTVALAVRARLRATSPEGNNGWDARVALGIGDMAYDSGSIVTSDGEAFRLSGHAFDSLGKRRLAVATTWNDVDETLELNTKFADETISSWTVKQARVVYGELLTRKSQKDLAEHLGMSPQNINFIWNLSKCPLILEYVELYKKLIDRHQDS